MQGKHLVFYDGECGLCDHTVRFLLKIDQNKLFMFAPLQGETAAKFLPQLSKEEQQEDTLILVENVEKSDQKIYILGKAIFRIFWLLGGLWSILGLMSFLPGWLYNWGYRLVAQNRKRIFNQNECALPPANTRDRFLK